MTETYLTAAEVAELTRMKKATIYKLAATGEIPCHKVRRRLLFPAKQIHEWVRNDGEMPATMTLTVASRSRRRQK